MKNNFQQQLQKIFEIQEGIQDIHPFLEKLYPIAIAVDDHFLIYDVSTLCDHYQQVKKAPVPMPIPIGVRAAFDLESYHGRMGCVVTPDVFDDLDGYSTIFHEFVHCQQAETREPVIKQRLKVARQALAAGDFMWEINHPFPYDKAEFIDLYEAFLAEKEIDKLKLIRKDLKDSLSEVDYEYMVWQEWKEGLARLIENRINHRLGLSENHGGTIKPFNRVVFYEGGSHYIEILVEQHEALLFDIEGLFDWMYFGYKND